MRAPELLGGSLAGRGHYLAVTYRYFFTNTFLNTIPPSFSGCSLRLWAWKVMLGSVSGRTASPHLVRARVVDDPLSAPPRITGPHSYREFTVVASTKRLRRLPRNRNSTGCTASLRRIPKQEYGSHTAVGDVPSPGPDLTAIAFQLVVAR